MANEQLTIGQDKARLSVIGKSWPDMNFDSGIGLDLSQIIFDILIDLGLDLPDIDFDDLDDITVIIGIDPDTEIVTLEYPDPDFDPDPDPDPDLDDLPDILDYPLPDLDWDDFIDNLEDLDIDPNTLTDLSFTGLDDLGIPTLVSLDMDFNIQEDELPASIEIVTPPKKLEYQDGERIDLTGMVVTAKKEDGSTWTSAKYPNGNIPLVELIVSPKVVSFSKSEKGKVSPYFDRPVKTSITDQAIIRYKYGVESWATGQHTLISVSNPLLTAVSIAVLDEIPSGYPPSFHNFNSWAFMASKNSFFYHTGGTSWQADEATFSGKTVYYGVGGFSAFGEWVEYKQPNKEGFYNPYTTYIEAFDYIHNNQKGIAWTMLYGDEIGINQVNLTWPRPGDGKELSANFEIVIEDSSGSGSGR